VEAVAQGHYACWVGPEGEEAACLAGGAAGDFGGFEEGDRVFGGVKGGVVREEVGGCGANDASAFWKVVGLVMCMNDGWGDGMKRGWRFTYYYDVLLLLCKRHCFCVRGQVLKHGQNGLLGVVVQMWLRTVGKLSAAINP